MDPGSIEQAPARNPAGNLFAKVSLWPALNQRIELSHNYAQGTLASARVHGRRRWLPPVLHGLREPATFNATRLAWTMSGSGGLSNELTVARLGEREQLSPGRRVSGDRS